VVAFQAAGSGMLWLWTPSSGACNLGLVSPGTSPSVAAVPGTPYIIAFQTNNGDLALWSPVSGTHMFNLGMAPRTSPSIATLPNGGYEIAFQTNTGQMWVYSCATEQTSSVGVNMDAETSPSVER
jgi:hypothetical protein